MHKRPIAVLVTALQILTASSASSQAVTPRSITAIKPSLGLVACVSQSGSQSKTVGAVGTGFFVNAHGDFITAAHVVEALDTYGKLNDCIGALEIPIKGWPKTALTYDYVPYAFSCVREAALDVAACHTVVNPFTDGRIKARLAPVQFESSSVEEGTPLAFSGFPLQILIPVTSVGVVAAYVLEPAGGRILAIDKIAWSGYSGSPVYLASGKVVGMILARGDRDRNGDVTKDALGVSYARPASELQAVLRSHDVPLGP